jgi:putative flippase GtrA
LKRAGKYFGLYIAALPFLILLIEMINPLIGNLYISRIIGGVVSETVMFLINSSYTFRKNKFTQ